MSEQPIALVMGASSGIGLACAEELADLGHRVFGASRTRPSSAPRMEWVQIDVTSDQSVDHAIRRIIEEHGRIDVVVNSAGYGVAGPLEDSSIEDARQQFETNFFGVLRVCRAVLPGMRSRGSGLIVNISSLGGVFGLPFQGLYSASKFALEGYTESLRLEMSGLGVRVVLIEPGDIGSTGITRNRKFCRPADGSSAYQKSFDQALRIIEREESNGAPPGEVAAVLRKLVNCRRPSLRYTVGHFSQRLAVVAKRFTCWAVFERIMKSYYGLGASRKLSEGSRMQAEKP